MGVSAGADHEGLQWAWQGHRGGHGGQRWSPSTRVRPPRELHPSKPGQESTRPKGRLHGAVLTSRLPVGFLAVWAVVYVNVWGLLLFYTNTAETQETGITGVRQSRERPPAKLPGSACSLLGRVQGRVCGDSAPQGQVRGQGGGKEGLANEGPGQGGTRWSSRPASMTAVTPSPQSSGRRRGHFAGGSSEPWAGSLWTPWGIATNLPAGSTRVLG